MKIRKHGLWATFGVMCAFLLASGAGRALAYQTDMDEPILNPFTIALDSSSTVIEKYPNPNTPIPGADNVISYEKAVQVGNTGYIDCYVRARLDFSESDIEKKSFLSWDGSSWYSIAEFPSHLPPGWVFNEKDGYYYYTPVLYADNWSEVSKDLNYDHALGEYFYKGMDSVLLTKKCITVPLIRYVRTEFDEPVDIRSYNLNVFSESVPYYFGMDYQKAWENYLDQ